MSNDEIARWLSQRIAQIDAEAEQHRAALADLDVEQQGLRLSLARIAAQRDSGVDMPLNEVLHRQAERRAEVATDPETEWPTSEPTTSTGDGAAPGRAREWEGVGHTEAVRRILEEATELMSPSDILAALQLYGYPIEDAHPIRGALAYLKRQGKANYARRGAWYLEGSPAHQSLSDDELFADAVGGEEPTDAETPAAATAEVSEHSNDPHGGDAVNVA